VPERRIADRYRRARRIALRLRAPPRHRQEGSPEWSQRLHHQRLEWELIGILKGWPPSPIPEAHRWLITGLQLRAALGHGDTPAYAATGQPTLGNPEDR